MLNLDCPPDISEFVYNLDILPFSYCIGNFSTTVEKLVNNYLGKYKNRKLTPKKIFIITDTRQITKYKIEDKT